LANRYLKVPQRQKMSTDRAYLDCYNIFSKLTDIHTGYFMSDNEPGGIENATHNTFAKLRLF
jgi:hypothetical protein